MTTPYTVERPRVETRRVVVQHVDSLGDRCDFFDFGKAAFGTLRIPLEGEGRLVVHLGEKLGKDGRLDRRPPGSIRYQKVEVEVRPGTGCVTLEIPPDQRNTGPGAIAMPERVGEVLPFRYAEIEHAGGVRIGREEVVQLAAQVAFDEGASDFESSDPVLNAVWKLCKYSIKATSFCGVYVDGDRERIPYEGDAYINQLSHYAVDSEYRMARYTHEYLLRHPTWVTEWNLHSVLMASADYEYTGETESFRVFYEDLKRKTLLELAREDGLISTQTGLLTRKIEEGLNLHHEKYIFPDGMKDLVDWPWAGFAGEEPGENDGHEMVPVNTVINAFHFRTVVLMSRIAAVLGKDEESGFFRRRAEQVRATILDKLFDEDRGVFVDGEGSRHSSLHANMFPLAFGLVPKTALKTVIAFIKSRGMACSVYGAQHLLDGLYRYRESEYGLGLMTARHDRSWWNMLEAGSTITLEAWDWKYKNNLDWNHAWGAAPANLIPRWVAGIRPAEPGFGKVRIDPQPGGLEWFRCKHPTPRGPVEVEVERKPDGSYAKKVELPEGMGRESLVGGQ